MSLDFQPLDVVRWEVLHLSADDDTTPDDLEEMAQQTIARAATAAEGRTLALRFELGGRGPTWNRVAADMAGWRARLRALAGDAPVPVHVEKLVLTPRTAPVPVSMDAGAAGELSVLLKEFAEDSALLEELKLTFGELKTRLESAVTLGDECTDPQDPELLRKALSSVEPLLLKGDGK